VIWELEYEARPWTMNDEHAGGSRGVGGHHGRAALTREWRRAFGRLCQVQRIPPLQWITVEARQISQDRRRGDVGAVAPAVKAAVDGIVDAGVIPDDSDVYVHAQTFRPALILGYSGLRLRIVGNRCSGEERAARERALKRRLLRKLTA
jgi:hypothetical protein